ncbi:uroporphyrinogen-III synthase [Luteimonas viscosa]|uniref:Uroporphyrinogen-III synthase n=1 Tax=Luteimonas viscosa TaxID=1132694 RepID=A0A5D4XU07_9GAMM|nr:uroporphyrinogen-III synthase [Luteimonas viscosa]TYT26270.1 uroporphyrinogen-III synthase [Luteimonas viscosa]
MSPDAATPKLRECYVISLRPVGGHAPMRRAAAAHGARVLALSPWRIEPRRDAVARAALREALQGDIVLFTSPSAVRAAASLQRLRARRGQAWLAVGSGTAAALRRVGIADVAAPSRMDSEGLLALPALGAVRGRSVGLVTAPGGRNLIAPTLARRGARVLRAEVYARVPLTPTPRSLARLRALEAPVWLALSSGEALQRLLDALPVDLLSRLRRARVLAASERLAQLARASGFADVRIAADARPRSLLAAGAGPARRSKASDSMRSS